MDRIEELTNVFVKSRNVLVRETVKKLMLRLVDEFNWTLHLIYYAMSVVVTSGIQKEGK